MFVLLPVALAASIELAAAERVPTFNVTPGCRAAARRANSPADARVCQQSERAARAKLERHWSQFSPSDEKRCVPLSMLGGMPTYTELHTCLELERDARRLHNQPAPAIAGDESKPR